MTSDQATGEVGALLRREERYSSHLTTSRVARDHGELAARATAKKRGTEATTALDPRDKRSTISSARSKKGDQTCEERAEAIAEIQKGDRVRLIGPPVGPETLDVEAGEPGGVAVSFFWSSGNPQKAWSGG